MSAKPISTSTVMPSGVLSFSMKMPSFGTVKTTLPTTAPSGTGSASATLFASPCVVNLSDVPPTIRCVTRDAPERNVITSPTV